MSLSKGDEDAVEPDHEPVGASMRHLCKDRRELGSAPRTQHVKLEPNKRAAASLSRTQVGVSALPGFTSNANLFVIGIISRSNCGRLAPISLFKLVVPVILAPRATQTGDGY